ncbi:MAG: helix-turn-helix transcriptional regulator [Clostridia bacterium]|nr:helix-turn-helix transcriptional regulator [Clostridia bacterium]
MEFCKILKNLLTANEITQKQLAAELNIGVSTIGNYVQGIREPDFDTLRKIATFFHVSIDCLLDHKPSTEQLDQEAVLLQYYRRLTSDKKDLLLLLAEAMTKQKTS